MNIRYLISKKLNQALINIGVNTSYKLKICRSTKIQFGDYQINGIIFLAKKIGLSSRQLSEKILKYINLNNIASKIEIVDPGFINIFLDPVFLSKKINISLKSNRLGINKLKSQTIVVDYSSPNIAKEMHVGHLRSTIIGDATVRILEFLGHKVIRANHIGDWGTQFGMLVAYLKKQKQENKKEIKLIDLEEIYQKAKKCYDEDKNFSKIARECVLKLQKGDKYILELWRKIVSITMVQNQILYDRLNVTLTHKNIMGESIYNKLLPDIVSDLIAKGLAVESNGAIVVFLEEFKNKEGKPMGVIIQKKDGGYVYTTIDIACVKYRYEKLHADRIIYYTDRRQYQHLIQVQMIVRKAGYIPNFVSLEHHVFGMILDKNGKPFKTRENNTIKLSDLLDEALKRARILIAKKNPNMSADEINVLSDIISVGALKYSDLSKKRTTNYVFDWDNMLRFEGNTAPYIQYAYTRIISIFRKANVNEDDITKAYLVFTKSYEVKLAVCLLQFEEILEDAARDGTPHIICSYIYNLAVLFSSFYEYCPILSSKHKSIFNSRLKLILFTAKTIKLGLNILGIKTVERM